MNFVSPLLSIVIPAYDVAPYVREAVDSALAQTHPHVEVVVVDDGSTDSTGSILESYGDRIVLIQQQNRGLAGARNTGIAHATGSYLGWLDADDIWYPQRAQLAIDYLESHPGVAAVTTDAYILDGSTITDRQYYRDFLKRGFPAPQDQLSTMIDHNFMFVGTIVRASVMRRYGGFDETLRRSEDYDLWMRLLLGGQRFGLIDEPLASYRVRPDSLSASKQAQWEAHLDVVSKHIAAIRRAGLVAPATVSWALARRAGVLGKSRNAASFYRDTLSGTDARRVRQRAKIALLYLQQLCGGVIGERNL